MYPVKLNATAVVAQWIRALALHADIRILAATDLNRKNRYWQLHYHTRGNKRVCQGSSGMTIINGRPVSQ